MSDLLRTDARGSCHCGAVGFVARFPSRFACHCHCESCRRSHGAAYVTWVGFRGEQLTIDRGAEHMATYESSPGTYRKFCSRCGTKLFFESSRWPGETHVVRAAFDEPPDREPEGDAFYEERVHWISWPAKAT